MAQILSTSYPALVQGLQTSFLSYLRTEVPGAAQLAPTPQGRLLTRMEAPDSERNARRTADDLLFALNDAWVAEKQALFGEEAVRGVYHDGARLFQSLSGCGIPSTDTDPTFQGRPADPEKVLQEVRKYDPEADRILEVECRSDVFDITSLFMIHEDIKFLGMFVYQIGGKQITFRIPSFTLLEAGLRFCLDRNAIKPCYVPGIISAEKINELHKTGYHPIGMPLKATPMHGRWAEPTEWPWHDWHHLIHASINIPFWVQKSAAVFCEVLWKKRTELLTGVVASMEDLERLIDLDLRRHEGNHIVFVIERILTNIAHAHGRDAAKSLHADFLTRIDKFFRGQKSGGTLLTEDTNYRKLRDRLGSLMS